MSSVEIRVAGRYRLGKLIGEGQFSKVYEGYNVHSGEEVAIKLEELKSRYPQILYEGKLMQQIQGGLGVPLIYWCGQDGDYNILVSEL
jgi:serine/threonine protein kinase